MPITRTSTLRHKSPRSTPSPSTPNPATPRPFQPPSYYAAAGGLSPRNAPLNTSYRDNAMPTKCHVDENTKRNHSRGQKLEPPSDSDSLLNMPATREPHQRMSTHSGIPLLEAQLLPSLRDTVDRMTRTSPRGVPSYRTGPKVNGMVDDGYKRTGRHHSHRNSPDLPPAKTTKRSQLGASLAHHQSKNDGLSIGIPYAQPTTSTSRLKEPTKSALKSSFRSPISSSASPKQPAPPAQASPSMAGSSLKNMKSLLSRKCSGTLKSPFNSNKSTSRKETPIIDVQETERPTPHLASKKYSQSNIPRPRTRYYNDDPARLEDSDLERRYEDDLRDRRKLMVANAAVSLSSSSTASSDVDSRKEQFLDNTNNDYQPEYTSNHAKNWVPAVGLGLSMSQAQHSSPRTPRQADIRQMPPEKNLRFSLPPSESEGSHYSDEFNNYGADKYQSSPGCYPIEAERNHRRNSFREEEQAQHLRNFEPPLESGPCHDDRSMPPPSRTTNSKRSPTFSASALDEESMEEGETESEREGYTFRHARRRRSSGCEPKLNSSPVHDVDGGPTHRPRSAACQRDSPSPRSSRIFPPGLRELIKNRNSFAKSSPPPVRRDDAPPVPQAPSTYHSSASGAYYADRYDEPAEQLRPTKSSPDYRGRDDGSASNRRSLRKQPTEASAIVEGYRSAAARERQAFGIPPSDSDEIFDRAADEQLSQVESEGSEAVDRTMWQEESEELSVDAESIFKALDYEESRRESKRIIGKQALQANTPRLSIISPTLTTSSKYDDDSHEPIEHRPSQVASIPNYDEHPTNEAPPGQWTAKTREGVIQEIFESEEDLLRLLHICMRLFILPLRSQNSRSWIAGVPPDVTKLLDWFDDIVNLHEEIYESLCLARDTMFPSTDRVSEFLRCFVQKVEVYQPYIVRLSDVLDQVTALTNAYNSDLGQFISIQQSLPDCENWTFERLLMLPVNRLAAYQDLFSRMLDLTPKTHQDYLSTFSLSRSTDMVIRVMTEVKIREDEYNLLKAFAVRVQGLPSSNELPTRERRLLHSGPLALVLSNLKNAMADEKRNSGSWRQGKEADRAKRVSKLLDAISSSPSTILEKSGSMKSPSAGYNGLNASSAPAPVKCAASSWFSRLPLGKRSTTKNANLATAPPITEQTDHHYTPALPALRTVSVHAFIFNDLVLLAQPAQILGDDPHWIISEDLGMFRPLSIAQVENRNNEGIALSLESMTVDLDNLNQTTNFRTMSFCTVDLLLPRSPYEKYSQDTGDSDSGDTLEQTWLLAFRKCCKTTLRKVTFPGVDQSEHSLNLSDRTFDTHTAVSSLMASGLPIPRSPSGTYPDMRGGPDSTFLGDEREERGWWSLRYQQVFREFQRQDSSNSDDDDSINI